MLLLRLAQLLRRNFGNVGAAHAQVEPLLADRPVARDHNLVNKRPSLPATFVGGERKDAVIRSS